MEAKELIDSVAATSGENELSFNLAISTNWGAEITDGDNTQVLRFTGQPSYVFDRFYKNTALFSKAYQCFATPTTTLDKSTGNLFIAYDYNTYMGQSSKMTGCGFWVTGNETTPIPYEAMAILPPKSFGYDPRFDKDHFNIRYNVNSMMTAFAVNIGIEPYDILDRAKGDFDTQRGCERVAQTSNPYLTWSTPLQR